MTKEQLVKQTLDDLSPALDRKEAQKAAESYLDQHMKHPGAKLESIDPRTLTLILQRQMTRPGRRASH